MRSSNPELRRDMNDLGVQLSEIGKNCPPKSRTQKQAIGRALGNVNKLIDALPSLITRSFFHGYGLEIRTGLSKNYENMMFNELRAEFTVTF